MRLWMLARNNQKQWIYMPYIIIYGAYSVKSTRQSAKATHKLTRISTLAFHIPRVESDFRRSAFWLLKNLCAPAFSLRSLGRVLVAFHLAFCFSAVQLSGFEQA